MYKPVVGFRPQYFSQNEDTYRILDELAEGGVITRIFLADRKQYYFLCANQEHHHHFVCESCRRVEDLDGCGLHGMDDEIATRTGGRVLSHILQVNGLCRDCVAVGGMSR